MLVCAAAHLRLLVLVEPALPVDLWRWRWVVGGGGGGSWVEVGEVGVEVAVEMEVKAETLHCAILTPSAMSAPQYGPCCAFSRRTRTLGPHTNQRHSSLTTGLATWMDNAYSRCPHMPLPRPRNSSLWSELTSTDVS